MLHCAAIGLMMLGLPGCTSAPRPAQGPVAWSEGLKCPLIRRSAEGDATFHSAEGAEPLRGVALVIHGLNTLPERMDALAEVLRSEGVSTLRVGLTGHNGSLEKLQSVTREQWIEDVLQAYCVARAEADEKHVPLYLVGFSLGAAAGLDLLETAPAGAVRYDGLILLAPSIEIRTRSMLVKVFRLLGRDFVLGSRNHPDYRANEGTPVAAYDSLFEIEDHLHETGLQRADVPALVVVDPDDELVDADGLKDLIRDQKLTQWSYRELKKTDAKLDPNSHHLILDESSLGTGAWNEMKGWIRDFVSRTR